MKPELQTWSLRGVIAQWILVRTFGYATALLDKLDADEYRRPSKREHVELLRGVCAALYRQIRLFGYPMYSGKPDETWVNGRWP